jgi:hypothetical protein
MIRAYVNTRLRRRHFHEDDEFFNAIEKEWNGMPDDLAHTFLSSFPARLTVCARPNGGYLSGGISG